MKKISLVFVVLCAVWISGCNKDIEKGDIEENQIVSLKDGAIIINNRPDVQIVHLNDMLKRSSTGEVYGGKQKLEQPRRGYIPPYEYNFKLVAEMSTLKVDGVDVQATHVKINDDGYAFVSYNKKDGPRTGGIVVYKYVVHGEKLEDVRVDVSIVTSMQMTKAQVNALDFYDGKLYVAGSSTDERLGYTDGYDCAFFMVMQLEPDNTFAFADPMAIEYLTSFQATSIRAVNNRVYITTGDGSLGTKGGLHIYDATSYEFINSILDLDNARSVDVDETNIFLMQAMPARITKYNLNGQGAQRIYDSSNEAMQKDAKSDMIITDSYLFTAMNESGLKMLNKDGEYLASRERPGPDPINEVTNSLSMNNDPKKNNAGEIVNSQMLLVANGGKGLYWYDIILDYGGTYIKETENNSILGGNRASTNYVESKGNIVFVADGLGGLKVLYFEPVKPPTPETTVIFDGFFYRNEQISQQVSDGVHSQIIELDTEGEIDWDAVYEVYNNYQWEYEFHQDWVTGWEVGSGPVFEFSGNRPVDAFTEEHLDNVSQRIDGEYIIYMRAIIEKPDIPPPLTTATVKFIGLKDIEGTTYTIYTDLYSQTVELDTEGEIDWAAVYASYYDYEWALDFDEDWVTGWDVNDGQLTFTGKRPNNAFTEEMTDSENIIYMYAIVDKPENVSYERYRAYVEIWNDIYLTYPVGTEIGNILHPTGLEHYNALLEYYEADFLPPYWHFDVENMKHVYDYWADILEADIMTACEMLGIDLAEYVRNHMSNQKP